MKGTSRYPKRVRVSNNSLITIFVSRVYFLHLKHGFDRLKTDVIYMKNGDRITCKIRSLEQGQLTIKQDYATSTVIIDWNQIDRIETKQPFGVVDTKGNAFNGIL